MITCGLHECEFWLSLEHLATTSNARSFDELAPILSLPTPKVISTCFQISQCMFPHSIETCKAFLTNQEVFWPYPRSSATLLKLESFSMIVPNSIGSAFQKLTCATWWRTWSIVDECVAHWTPNQISCILPSELWVTQCVLGFRHVYKCVLLWQSGNVNMVLLFIKAAVRV